MAARQLLEAWGSWVHWQTLLQSQAVRERAVALEVLHGSRAAQVGSGLPAAHHMHRPPIPCARPYRLPGPCASLSPSAGLPAKPRQ